MKRIVTKCSQGWQKEQQKKEKIVPPCGYTIKNDAIGRKLSFESIWFSTSLLKELVESQARDIEEKERIIQKLKNSLAAKDDKLQVPWCISSCNSFCFGSKKCNWCIFVMTVIVTTQWSQKQCYGSEWESLIVFSGVAERKPSCHGFTRKTLATETRRKGTIPSGKDTISTFKPYFWAVIQPVVSHSVWSVQTRLTSPFNLQKVWTDFFLVILCIVDQLYVMLLFNRIW